MKKIKAWIADARTQKRVHSDDLERIISRCNKKYGYLFPSYLCTKKGSRSVHHFNAPGVPPVSLERVHGNREYVPKHFANLVLDGLEALAAYIELHVKEDNDDAFVEGSSSEDDE